MLQLTLSLGRLERIKLLERELASSDPAEMAARLANAALDDSTGTGPSYTTAPDDTEAQVATARQVLQRYYEHRVPGLGERVDISPDPTLQVPYKILLVYDCVSNNHACSSPYLLFHGALLEQALTFERTRVDLPPATNMATLVQLADAESAEALQHWTLATLCRCLSLNNILSLLTSALLERQIALFCPNIGLLSASVLSLVPLLRPFSWQSLMLPVLPLNMLEIVEVRAVIMHCDA